MLEHLLGSGILLLSTLLLRSFFFFLFWLLLVMSVGVQGASIYDTHICLRGRGILFIPFPSKAKQSQGYMYMGNKASSNREAWS